MANKFAQQTNAALVAGSLMISLLAGCGTQGLPTTATAQTFDVAQAEATSTLMKGLGRIHGAIFNKLDKDSNKKVDEYEAGPNLSMGDFKKADKGGNHSLSFREFKTYAMTNLFFFKDSPKAFTSRFRKDLGSVFNRLDTNNDGILIKNETSLRDMAKLKLTFEYPRLNIVVKLNKIDAATFGAADKTGDGNLGQAEFEDLYIEMVIAALGGTPGTGGGDVPPTPAPGGDTPPAPPAEEPVVDPAPPVPAEEPAAPKKTPKKK